MDQSERAPRHPFDSALSVNTTPLNQLRVFLWVSPVVLMLLFSGAGAGLGSLGLVLAPVGFGALRRLSERCASAPARRVLLATGVLDVIASAMLMWTLPGWPGFLMCFLVAGAVMRVLQRPDRERPELSVLEAMLWRSHGAVEPPSEPGTGMRAASPGEDWS